MLSCQLQGENKSKIHSSPQCRLVPRLRETRATVSPGLRDKDRFSVPGSQKERRCSLGDGSHKLRCSFILVFAVGATERQQTQSFAVPLVQQRLKNFILKVQSSCGSLSDFPLLHSTSDAAIFLCYLKNNIGYHSWASCPFHALLLSKKTMPHL